MLRHLAAGFVLVSFLTGCAGGEPGPSDATEKVLPLSAKTSSPQQPWRAAYKRGDYSTALIQLRPLANKGNGKAQNTLGLMYRFGQGVPQDFREAAKWYRAAAEQGNAAAQRNLGNRYRLGQGVPKDYAKAVEWYRRASEQGLADAQRLLGLMYANGHGVKRDTGEALKWYRLALDQLEPLAKQGNARAQNTLGLLYRYGQGVQQDYSKAAYWYRKAADQGHRSAQRNLGNRYRVGKGVPQNYDEAIKWYRRAASQGDAQAEFYLGFMYQRGQGVTRDGVEALKWYRRAADGGDAKAQTRLGLMYSKGQGVPQDYSLATEWARKAAEQGHQPARQLLDAIKAGSKSSFESSKPREGGDYVFTTEAGRTVIPLPAGEWRVVADKLSHEMADMGWFAESWIRKTVMLMRAPHARVTGIISLWVNNSMLWGEGGIVPTDFCYTAQPNWKFHKQVSALPKDTFCWGVRYVRFPKTSPEGLWEEAMQKMTALGKVPPLGTVATHVRFFRSNVDQILWVDYYIIGTKRAPAWSWQAGRDWAEALVPRILAGFEGRRPKD